MRSSAHLNSILRGHFLTETPRYDFEYEDDDEDDSGDVDIENKYYNAKQMKSSDPEDAVKEFLGIPPLEEEKGDWGFKGLKQAIKLEFRLGQYDKVRYVWEGAVKSATNTLRRQLSTIRSCSPTSNRL